MSTTYLALIGDAVASRALPPPRRARLQRAFRGAIPEFNRRWRTALAARFAVTLGDEFQALLTTARPLWELLHEVHFRFPEVEWVVACGLGAIATRLESRATAPEGDVPCFHAARAALEHAKQQRLLIGFGGFAPALDPLASYYSALYWSWTPRQRRAATLLRLGPPAFAAAQLKVDRSAISHLARRMPGPSSRPAIRCSRPPCWRRCEPAVRRPAARLHPRRHAVAGAGGLPPARREPAARGSRDRRRRGRSGRLPGGARCAAQPRPLVGPGRAARHRLSVRVRPRDERDPGRARVAHAANAPRRRPYRGRD